MLTDAQMKFVTEAAAAAVASEKATGLPAEFSLSQAIFESAWGTRAPSNNIFGIKADAHGSGTQYVLTHEYIDGTWKEMPLAFEKYDSLEACFEDHARLMTEGAPYAAAWAKYMSDADVDEFVAAVGPIYATDPNYTTKITAEMNSRTVKDACAKARLTVPA